MLMKVILSRKVNEMKIKKLLSVLLTLATLFSLISFSAFEASAATKIYGIDVSSYQGVIDWEKVKASGVKFAILRIGTSKGKDSAFERNYIGAKSVGMPIGVYYYSYASTIEAATKEANTVLTWLAGHKFEYPIYYDIEDSSLLTGLTTADRTNLCIAYNTVLENAGYFCGVYSGKYWLNNYLDLATLQSKYAIWMAQYLNSGTDSKDYSSSYPIWQYSSKGAVSGISGNVDLDVCYYDYPSVIMKAGKNNYAKDSTSDTLCGYYKCTATSLNMRSGAGTSYASLGTIPNGAEVAVVGFNDGYTWANLIYNGIKAWSSLSYLSYVRAFPTLTVNYDSGGVSAAVPASEKPNAYDSIVVTESEMKADGYDFVGWSLKRASDGKYYSLSSTWTDTPSALSPGTVLTFDETMFDSSLQSETYTLSAMWNEVKKDTTGWYTVNTSSSNLNIRSGAGTSYAVLTSAPKGSTIAVTGFSDDGTWANVIYSGISGWCSMTYLLFEKNFQSYVVAYDTAGIGSIFVTPITCKPFDSITVNDNIPLADGYEFVTWNLQRMSDGKYLSDDGTWKTETECEKKSFAPSATLTLDLSLIDQASGNDMFVLKASWNEIEKFIYGDADGDSEITIKDMRIVIKYLLGTIDDSGLVFNAADVDGDGEITTKDMRELKKYLLGTLEIFTAETMKAE